MKNKIFLIFISAFWIVIYIFIVKIGLLYDKKKLLEAQERYEVINDSSPEAYYP